MSPKNNFLMGCVTSLLVASCVRTSNSLEDAFLEIAAVDTYLDFPHTPDFLELCFKDNDRQCLRLYDGARRAAARLFDAGRATALQRTLDGVTKYCREPRSQTPDQRFPWAACTGAANAFYFFDARAEDQQIRQFVRQLDEQVQYNLLVTSYGYAGAWVRNRPERERWVELIGSLPVLDRGELGRAGLQNVFRGPVPLESRIALIDPRYLLSPARAQQLAEIND